jgi:hypothetical protein
MEDHEGNRLFVSPKDNIKMFRIEHSHTRYEAMHITFSGKINIVPVTDVLPVLQRKPDE